MGYLYSQLCETERYMITCGLRAGHSIRQIALSLQRSASCISRELRRNRSTDNCYDAVLADKHAKERRYKPRREKKLDVHRGLRHYVVIKLDKYWSPQQISGRLTKDFPTDKGMRVQIGRFKVSRPCSMIQKGKNRGFRTIRHIIVDSEIAQSVNTFPELNILGSYKNVKISV